MSNTETQKQLTKSENLSQTIDDHAMKLGNGGKTNIEKLTAEKAISLLDYKKLPRALYISGGKLSESGKCAVAFKQGKKPYFVDNIEHSYDIFAAANDFESSVEKLNLNSNSLSIELGVEDAIAQVIGLNLGFSKSSSHQSEIYSSERYSQVEVLAEYLITAGQFHIPKDILEVTDEFKKLVEEALNENSIPKLRELFQAYGQFIPTKYYLGAKVSRTYTYEEKDSQLTQSSVDKAKLGCKAELKATVEEAVKVKTNTSVSTEEKNSRKSTNSRSGITSNSNFKATGGSVSLASDIPSWVESLTNDNLVLIKEDECVSVLNLLEQTLKERCIKLLKSTYFELEIAFTNKLSKVGDTRYFVEDKRRFINSIATHALDRISLSNYYAKPLTIYQPVLSGDWYYIGQYTQVSSRQDEIMGNLLIVKALPEVFNQSEPPLKAAAKFEKVWSHKTVISTLNPLDDKWRFATFWKPLAPHNYQALGHLITLETEHDINQPDERYTNKFMCVREDLLTPGKPSFRNWNNDHIELESRQSSVWSIKPEDEQKGLNVGTFFTCSSHETSGKNIWCIKKDSPKIKYSIG